MRRIQQFLPTIDLFGFPFTPATYHPPSSTRIAVLTTLFLSHSFIYNCSSVFSPSYLEIRASHTRLSESLSFIPTVLASVLPTLSTRFPGFVERVVIISSVSSI